MEALEIAALVLKGVELYGSYQAVQAKLDEAKAKGLTGLQVLEWLEKQMDVEYDNMMNAKPGDPSPV